MSRPQGGQDHDPRAEKKVKKTQSFKGESRDQDGVKAAKHEKIKERRFRFIKLNRQHLPKSQ
jgi:hypothetical protein